ncbi:MAG: hypothetical protein AAFQ80_06540 [Cyanobacteria bacterium J06621_8]
MFDKLSYSNDTTCINTDKINTVENTVINILKEKGYVLVPQPPLVEQSEVLIKEFLRQPWLINSLKIIGLLNNDSNWITMKTSSPKMFCCTLKTSRRVMLSELSIRSGFQAFHNHVEGSRNGVLLEASVNGDILASGYVDYDDIDEMVFLSQPVRNTTKKRNFHLLDVPKEFHIAGVINDEMNEAEKRQKEQELETLFNEQPHQAQHALSEWGQLHMSWFERTDRDLKKLICKSDYFWDNNNLLYQAYAESEKLRNEQVKLLFFCSETLIKEQNLESIWLPITSRKDFGIKPEIPW